ncbi:leucine-rich repeat domain-containing protein [Streptomyces odontomachi]|uniref:leucine-rich repeat domain-containing protein n=1 Tax=Streptomyces odontomachi TaxID=2944940 RepID=UPI002109CA0E|nr:COR domain-containing protein [Streptomyces sp. ODS25]
MDDGEIQHRIAEAERTGVLDLSSMGITEVPADVRALTSLKLLRLPGNRLSVLPDWIGDLTALETLDLAENGMLVLPESFGNLTALETLDLAGNELSVLPASFGDLTALEELDLAENGLSVLPESFGNLTALETLDLAENELSVLPDWIGDLTALGTLDLAENGLSVLPESLGNLTALEELDLSANGLSVLPESFGNLSALQTLDLAGNELSVLPESFGNLTVLRTLDLEGNELSGLPESFGDLTALETLYLEGNVLSALPESFGNLVDLAWLDLSGNGLSVLPESFGNLTALQTLYLEENELSALPESIGDLTNLNMLVLSGNELSTLPVRIGSLDPLKTLNLERNPLTTPPPEVVAAGLEAVKAFMAGLATASVRQWASKVLLVGQGRAGKTSLLRALREEGFDPQEESTHGLRVTSLDMPHPDPALGGVTMNLSAWDFGGQEIYHATHQFFLSERSLFLLLWDAQVGWRESRLYYWLDMIKARAPKAPVVLVATHIGPRPPDFPLGDLQRAYPGMIVKSLGVDNATGRGIDEVREAIGQSAAGLPLMGIRWPTTWLEAADAIRSHPENHIPTMGLHEIMAEHGVTHPAHQEGLATALHSLGDILYYPEEDELGDLVVLRPQWLTGYLSRVLDDPDSAVRAGGGLFTRAHQRDLWPDLDPGMRHHFLAMMERFDLSYRTNNPTTSLVVELLPWDPPAYEPRWQAAQSTHRELRLRYRLHTVPPGIPTWFIAREQRFASGLHWRTGVLLQHPDGVHVALLTLDQHAKTAELAVRGPYPQDFFAVLKDGFQQTLDRYPGLGVDYLVPCPERGADGTPCPHEFRLEQLQARIRLSPRRERIECPVSINDINVRQLLEGIEPPTTELNETLATVVRQQTQLLRQGQDQATRLTRLQQTADAQAQSAVIQAAALAEQQRAFLAAQRRDQNWHQVLCPTVMALEYVRRRALGGSVARLHLYCEAPGAWHRAPDAEPYELKLTSDRVQAVLPFATAILKIIKYAVPVAGAAIGMVSEDLAKQLESDIAMTKALVDTLSDNLPDGGGPPDVPTRVRAVDDPKFRAMQQLLLTLDPACNWGGLSKVSTPEGDVFWLCNAHAQQYRGLPGQSLAARS